MKDLAHLRALEHLVKMCIYAIELEVPEVIDWELFKRIAIKHIQNIKPTVEAADEGN